MKNIYLTIALATVLHMGNAQFIPLYEFNQPTGKGPYGAVITDGIYFYGTTGFGGVDNQGVVYRVLMDGTGYEVLHSFALTGGDGRVPQDDLLLLDGWLFGTTDSGGANNKGTIFKIRPDGSDYVIIYNFQNDPDGMWPNGVLISDGTFLYGTTYRGGTSYHGTVFKIMPDGTGYEKIKDFGTPESKYPLGGVLLIDDWLYGMSYAGGPSTNGDIFRIKTDGTDYEVLHVFDVSTTGQWPQADLMLLDGWLYGTAQSGGAHGQGTLFRLQPDGSNMTVLVNFQLLPKGRTPHGNVITDGTYLYGFTEHGGLDDDGTIFRVRLDGTDFLKMFEFEVYVTGNAPLASPLLIDGWLYGTTYQGGEENDGQIFKFQYQEPTSIENTATNSYGLYPNPIKSNEVLRSSKNFMNADIAIYNAFGQLITSYTKAFGNTIAIGTLPTGVYSIVMNENGKQTVDRIVVE